jgi:hypothetical protein
MDKWKEYNPFWQTKGVVIVRMCVCVCSCVVHENNSSPQRCVTLVLTFSQPELNVKLPTFEDELHRLLIVIECFGKHCSWHFLNPEDGNCSVCQNIGYHSTFDVARPQKPKLYIQLWPQKLWTGIYNFIYIAFYTWVNFNFLSIRSETSVWIFSQDYFSICCYQKASLKLVPPYWLWFHLPPKNYWNLCGK